jgi:hypothetical protein
MIIKKNLLLIIIIIILFILFLVLYSSHKNIESFAADKTVPVAKTTTPLRKITTTPLRITTIPLRITTTPLRKITTTPSSQNCPLNCFIGENESAPNSCIIPIDSYCDKDYTYNHSLQRCVKPACPKKNGGYGKLGFTKNNVLLCSDSSGQVKSGTPIPCPNNYDYYNSLCLAPNEWDKCPYGYQPYSDPSDIPDINKLTDGLCILSSLIPKTDPPPVTPDSRKEL